MPYSRRPIPAAVYGRLKYNLKNFLQAVEAQGQGLTSEDLDGLSRLCDQLFLAAASVIDYDDGGSRISPPLGYPDPSEAVAVVIATGGPHDREDRVLCELQAELPPIGTRVYAHNPEVSRGTVF